MNRALAVISGGMDSVTAMYYVALTRKIPIVAAMFFDYGQRGAAYEFDSAQMCIRHLRQTVDYEIPLLTTTLDIYGSSALTDRRGTLDPGAKREDGLPVTFVPGRNLIFIAHAASAMYQYNANVITGGWSSVDVDYPDCSITFIHAAEVAVRVALNRNVDIIAPLVQLTKVETVTLGEHLNVPWHLTRSCYGSYKRACLRCDSCRIRIAAFARAGVRDPLVVDDTAWDTLSKEFTNVP